MDCETFWRRKTKQMQRSIHKNTDVIQMNLNKEIMITVRDSLT